jgi:hypothetical protein
VAVIRANFISGQVQENPLSSVATQLTMSGKLTNLPTVAGADRAYLTIDPEGTDTLAGSGTEVVAVSAYTQGAGTATIARHQRGTTAKPHSQGVKIALSWMKEDGDDVGLLATGPPAPAVGPAGVTGSSTAKARQDHGHELNLGVWISGALYHLASAVELTTDGTVSVTPSYDAGSDRVSLKVDLVLSTGNPTAETYGAAALVGVSNFAPHADHRHAMPTHNKADHDALNIDADTLDGHDSGYFAADADLSGYETHAEHTKAQHDGLNIDADTLDGHDSTFFVAEDNKRLRVRAVAGLFSAGGSGPAVDGTDQLWEQMGTGDINADGSGNFSFGLPVTFPNGLVQAEVWVVDLLFNRVKYNVMVDYFTSTTATIVGQIWDTSADAVGAFVTCKVSWRAVGW